jgi:tRNA nucleotidyltransferase (CCA-adding enzyme)
VLDWLALTFPDKKGLAWFIYLMALTDRLRGPELTELAAALDLKKKEVQVLNEERPRADHLARSHKKTASFRPSQVYDLFSGLSWPSILFVMAKTENQTLAHAGAAFLTGYRLLRPLITGRDLLALGWPSGPLMKDILEDLRRARLDGLVTTRSDELEWAKKALEKEP